MILFEILEKHLYQPELRMIEPIIKLNAQRTFSVHLFPVLGFGLTFHNVHCCYKWVSDWWNTPLVLLLMLVTITAAVMMKRPTAMKEEKQMYNEDAPSSRWSETARKCNDSQNIFGLVCTEIKSHTDTPVISCIINAYFKWLIVDPKHQTRVEKRQGDRER